jgi:hypothetical protein
MISIAGCALFLVSISAMRFVVADAHVPTAARTEPEACSLLSPADASAALEVESLPGKRITDSDPKGCIWSDPGASDSSRRVALVLVSLNSFHIARRNTFAAVEPVAGIGDEAFYQAYPNSSKTLPASSPFLWVRKGNSAFSLRILTRLKPKPFTIEQEKAKEAVLAKTAVAKL